MKNGQRDCRGNRWERKYSQCISLCNKASVSVEAGGHNSRRNSKNIEGVLSVVKGGGQYQIVIGRHVGDVYQELLSVYDMQKEESGLKDAKEFKEEMKDKKISSRFIDTISGVFTPILNLLIATGIIKCFLALMTATGLMDATAGTYQILSIAGDCFFYFMPVFLGYTAMKKFGGTPFVGMAIGAALVYPSIAVIMGGEPLYTLLQERFLSHLYMLHFWGFR